MLMKMYRSLFLFLFIWSVTIDVIISTVDVPFTMIDAVQTECEYQGLTIGSRLVDAFNSYSEDVPVHQRLQHPYYNYHHLFHRMMQKELFHHNHAQRASGNNEESNSNSNSASALVSSGASHTMVLGHPNISRATAEPLHHKWIYFLGDSSLLPIRNTLLEALHGRGGHGHLKEKCVDNTGYGEKIENLVQHTTLIQYNQINDKATCHNLGAGNGGKISFERRDYLLEKFQEKYFEQHPLLTMDIQTHVTHAHNQTTTTGGGKAVFHHYPDVLVVQVGYETCIQAYGTSATKNHKNRDEWFSASEKNIISFMKHLREMILTLQQRASSDNINGQTNNITVVIVIPGRDAFAHDDNNFCVWKLGRIITVEAHRNHFLVLEREEIEHRLTIISEYGADILSTLGEEYSVAGLLNFPGPQIVLSALTSVLYCLHKNMTLSLD